MPCFHPIKAFYPFYADNDGKRYLKFGRNRYQYGNISNAVSSFYKKQFNNGNDFDYDCDFPFPVYFNVVGNFVGLNIKVPCGKCIGCRLDYSRQWALRSIHEAQMHNHYLDCSFITLTFNDDMLYRRSNPGSINKQGFATWLKRLRKAVKADYNKEFRIMACGEYGSKYKRPHYHMLVYGFNFPDKQVFKYNKVKGRDVLYYRSPFLEKIWCPAYSSDSYGFSVLGDVNFESSAYVARYVTKKLFGKVADRVYKNKEPEFFTTSRMPGLGFDWFMKYYKEIFERGYCYNPKGFKAPIPRYYQNKLQEIDPELYNVWRMTKEQEMINNLFVENIDSTKERLICREELKKYNLHMLARSYESDGSELIL